MGLLQSLGLAGASKAVRRLLHRSSHSSATATASITSEAQDAPLKAEPASNLAGTTSSRLVESAHSLQNDIEPIIGQEDSSMLSQKASTLAIRSQSADGPTERKEKDQRGIAGIAVESSNEENHHLKVDDLGEVLATIDLRDASEPTPVLKNQQRSAQDTYQSDHPAIQAEKARHQKFTEEALDMARLALRTNETPVGCVLVHGDQVIAKGMNATNVTRNGTRHAEFMAVTALLSYPPKDGPRTTRLLSAAVKVSDSDSGSFSSAESERVVESNEDGSKGHLYPYGQKLHPDPIVDQSILRECDLYVTVEPCVMCASLLRQLGIRKVYFGAVNDKFGGTGGVFSIHANSDPSACSIRPRSISRQPPPLVGAAGTLGESFPIGGGDGGNVEKGYEIEGGWGRDEAVGLLRRFYVQENGRAPVPRKKEGRAARLAAMMDPDGPDAVCAALLCADGMLATEKVPTPASAIEGDIGLVYGDSKTMPSSKTVSAVDDEESDKENTLAHS